MPVLKRAYEAISGKCSRCIGMGTITPIGLWQCPECKGTGLSSKKTKEQP